MMPSSSSITTAPMISGVHGSRGSISMLRYCLRPVEAGINLPMITFSLRPSRLSVLPSIDASVRTFVVSWKEAADRKLSVASEALVIPRTCCSPVGTSVRLTLVFFFSSALRFATNSLTSTS